MIWYQTLLGPVPHAILASTKPLARVSTKRDNSSRENIIRANEANRLRRLETINDLLDLCSVRWHSYTTLGRILDKTPGYMQALCLELLKGQKLKALKHRGRMFYATPNNPYPFSPSC